ncbi:MAG: hypothetical protein QXX57_00115 [Nitrososphaerota archaeon]
MPAYEVAKDLGLKPYRAPFKIYLKTRLQNLGSLDGVVKVQYSTSEPWRIIIPERYETVIKGNSIKEFVDTIEYSIEELHPDSEYEDTINAVFTPVGAEQEDIVVRFTPRFTTGYGIKTYEATNDPKQRKIHYMAGRYWFFFSNGTKIYYQHSIDTVNWSSPIPLFGDRFSPILQGFRFDTFFDGTFLHLAWWKPADIYYVRGTPNTDGTITFGTEQYVDSIGMQTISLSVDTGGYPWIAIDGPTPDLTENQVVVYKSSTNDGTWVTAAGFPQTLETTTSAVRCTILQAPLGKMIAFWTVKEDYARARVWDGTSWGLTKLSSIQVLGEPSYGAVVKGSIAHIVYASYSGLTYETFNADTQEFGDLVESVIDEPYTTGTSWGMITLDDATGDIYISWIRIEGVTHLLRRRRRLSTGVWEDPATVAIIQPPNDLNRPTQSHLVTPAGIGYAWVVGSMPGEYETRILFTPI